MTVQQEWWFISDLHIAAGASTSPGRRIVELMPRFLTSTVCAGEAPERHLVLLGDAFELDGTYLDNQTDPVQRLQALADRHADFFGALGECLGSGATVEVVCGNHDGDLVRPEVQRALAERVGSGRRLRFHPWFLYVPGVLYAEHGHQHHELNRVPTLLEVPRPGGAEQQPRSVLQAWSRIEGQRGLPTRVVAASRAMGRTRRAESRARSPEYDALLVQQAAGLGLPEAAVRELADVSAFTVPSSLVRTGARVVGRRLGRSHPGDYMKGAAQRIDATLARHDCRVPAYVFGHNHRAETTSIAAGTARYLNSGTWGPDVRGPGPDRRDLSLFPYAHVRAVGGAVECDVVYWRAPAGCRQ